MPTKPIARRPDIRAVLRPEQLEAWRVAQQHLLEPASRRAMARVVSDMVAIQAQVASAAELQLRARVDGITATTVREAIAGRVLIKTWAMRGTIHLVTAEDLPLLVAALGSRTRHTSQTWLRYFKVTLEQMEQFFVELPKALDGEGMTRQELADTMATRVSPDFAEELRSGWGTLLKPAAFMGLLCFGPSEGGRVTFVRPDRWIKGWKPSTLSPDEAMQEMVRRYLHGYGPAPHTEFAHWWGADTSRARRAFATLGEELAAVEVDGEPMWALAKDLPRLAGTDPLPARRPHVRLLPNFDPYTTFYAPRGRLVTAERYDRVFRVAGWISPVVLVNGIVAGVWALGRKKDRIELTIEAFEELKPAVRRAIDDQVEAIGAFSGLPATPAYGQVRGQARVSSRVE